MFSSSSSGLPYSSSSSSLLLLLLFLLLSLLSSTGWVQVVSTLPVVDNDFIPSSSSPLFGHKTSAQEATDLDWISSRPYSPSKEDNSIPTPRVPPLQVPPPTTELSVSTSRFYPLRTASNFLVGVKEEVSDITDGTYHFLQDPSRSLSSFYHTYARQPLHAAKTFSRNMQSQWREGPAYFVGRRVVDAGLMTAPLWAPKLGRHLLTRPAVVRREAAMTAAATAAIDSSAHGIQHAIQMKGLPAVSYSAKDMQNIRHFLDKQRRPSLSTKEIQDIQGFLKKVSLPTS